MFTCLCHLVIKVYAYLGFTVLYVLIFELYVLYNVFVLFYLINNKVVAQCDK